jgi:thioesterase domain-containing protein/acyl carrier protein
LHVVDERLREVPVGVAGELLIGGAGLAQGYRGRDDLTVEKFVATPFAGFPEAGPRVYRTGDLVRWRRDGRLEFLGRIDNQVKVRGFRIELGEIETVLDAHDEVAEAVVVVREDAGGEKQLVGYVVRQPGSSIGASDLRRHVGASLPAYMVPAAVVILDAFPRTPNGKTDRKSLPAPDAASMRRDDVVAPRDELETRLLAVWQEVLGISPIGVTDNFFDLGVHSLTAARLFARIEDEFGQGLPLGAVFRSPTIAELAEALRDGRAAHAAGRGWRSLVPLQPRGEKPPIFGVHGGAGTILLYHELSRRLGPEQPFYGLQVAGLYGDIAPDLSIGAMADRYIAEITDVQPHGPYVLLGYCFGALVAYEMADRLQQRGERVALVGAINGPAPSYITRYDPLFNDEGEVARPEPVDMSLRARLERQTSGRRTRAQQVEALGAAVVRRVRRTAQNRWREARYDFVLRTRRPLPDWMREGYYVQRIAEAAQRAFAPRRIDVPIAVFVARGLYASRDLGWGDLTTGAVHAVEVPGEGQSTPRRTMREPYVATIAEALRVLLEPHRS